MIELSFFLWTQNDWQYVTVRYRSGERGASATVRAEPGANRGAVTWRPRPITAVEAARPFSRREDVKAPSAVLAHPIKLRLKVSFTFSSHFKSFVEFIESFSVFTFIQSMKYSTLAKFMKHFLLPTEMVLKTEN